MAIKLATEGKTTRQIAETVHMSLRDIGIILRKETGDQELVEREKKLQEAEKEKHTRWKSLSPYARAFQMFKDKRTLADVSIELDLKSSAVLDFYNDYLDLMKMSWLTHIHNDLKEDFQLFCHLYRRIKKEGLTKQDITDLIKNQQKLKDLDNRVQQYCKFIRELHLQKQQLEKEIEMLRTVRL
jgi:RNA processing factor Prp31